MKKRPEGGWDWRHIKGYMPDRPPEKQQGINCIFVGETTSKWTGEPMLVTLCHHDVLPRRVGEAEDPRARRCSQCSTNARAIDRKQANYVATSDDPDSGS